MVNARATTITAADITKVVVLKLCKNSIVDDGNILRYGRVRMK